jgi:hypothetical protein
MSMCERDQNSPWGYDLFRDPFAYPAGLYYGVPPPGYCDGSCCDLHYGRGTQLSLSFWPRNQERRQPRSSFLHPFGDAGASHPDEPQLHSSAFTYDLYNPSVGVYHPGAEDTHDDLVHTFKHDVFFSPLKVLFCVLQEAPTSMAARRCM